MGIKYLNIYGDSQLVINQLLEEYEVKKEDLIPYYKHAMRLLDRLDIVKLEHVPRGANKMVNALASLATTLALGAEEEMTIPVCSRLVVSPDEENLEEDANIICDVKTDEEDWRQPIINYLKHGKLPTDPRHKTEIRWRASRFLYYNRMLYRCSFLGLWLRCLDMKEAKQAMEEAHSGVCRALQ